MWILRLQNAKENEEDVKKIWYIVEKSIKYTVGRRQDNQDQPNIISLIGDKSVSREHAIFDLDADDQLHVEDLSSRYGTFYFSKNGSIEQLPVREKKLLSCGDVLRFGALNNIWKINQISFGTCTSTCKLTNETLAMLKRMHVSMFPQWTDDCTHLTMSCITLTLKVLSALVAARPIVKPEFWKDCYLALQSNCELPKPQDYLPSVQEPTLNQQTANFLVDPLRKRVFLDKTFFFFTKSQMDKYKSIIESASGTTDLLRFSKMKQSQLCSPNSIIVQSMNEELSQDTQTIKVAFDKIVQHLNKNNCRVIPEAEIGLAILSNSLRKFCNPKFSFVEEILKSPPSRASNEENNIEIFALETEPYATSYQGSSKNFGSIISPFSNKSDKKNQNSSSETSNTNSMTECKEVKQNRKMLRNLSPEPEEPPTKKKASNFRLNVPKFTNKTQECPDTGEEMFNFENDSTKPKTEFNSTLNVKLNVKLNVNNNKKRVNAFIPDEDNNLFDFLPSESQESNKRCKKTKIICIDDEKPNNKRICLGKGSILDRNTPSVSSKIDNTNNSTSLQSKLENIRWTSSKNPSSTSQIKEENLEKENKSIDEVDGKMETLCIKPAIVVVNNNLIKREKLVDKTCNSSGEMKTNFKKFSKIQPLKPQTEIIPRSKFFIYEIEASNLSHKMKRNIVPDEEDEVYDFSLLDRNIRNSKTTSRRRL